MGCFFAPIGRILNESMLCKHYAMGRAASRNADRRSYEFLDPNAHGSLGCDVLTSGKAGPGKTNA